MKKYFLLLAATIGLMMASCSKDDNEIIEPEPTPIPTPNPDPDPTPTPKPEFTVTQAFLDSIKYDLFDKSNIVDFKEMDSELISAEEMADKIFGPDGANGDEELAAARRVFLLNCQNAADSIANATGQNAAAMLFGTQKFNYVTVDENNNPLTLSAWMCWGAYWAFGTHNMKQNHIVFICPYTHCKWDECATESDGGMEKYFIGCDNLFIIPDGQGFGIDKDAPQTYLAHHLHAQQYYDCLVAADRIYREDGGKYEDNVDLRVVGASQGGGDALSLHKYLETHYLDYDLSFYYDSEYSEALKPVADLMCETYGVPAGTRIIKIPLAQQWNMAYSYVAVGPYNPEATLQTYLKWGALSFPCVLPMVLKTMLAINPDLSTKYKEEEFYSDLYLKHKDEFDEAILKKTKTSEELNALFRKHLVLDGDPDGAPLPIDRILSKEMLNTESDMCKDMMAALGKEDLTKGWTPSVKCYMYNCETDEVVPYINSVLLKDFMGNLADVSNSLASGHVKTCVMFFTKKW